MSIDEHSRWIGPNETVCGVTRRGPRDDFVLTLNQLDAKTYASEGQQRGLVLALRLAEFSIFVNHWAEFLYSWRMRANGELDGQKKSNFHRLLPEQVCNLYILSSRGIVIWETFEVRSGGFLQGP